MTGRGRILSIRSNSASCIPRLARHIRMARAIVLVLLMGRIMIMVMIDLVGDGETRPKVAGVFDDGGVLYLVIGAITPQLIIVLSLFL